MIDWLIDWSIHVRAVRDGMASIIPVPLLSHLSEWVVGWLFDWYRWEKGTQRALRNGWTDRDVVCGEDSRGPKKSCVTWGAHWRHRANTIKRPVRGGSVQPGQEQLKVEHPVTVMLALVHWMHDLPVAIDRYNDHSGSPSVHRSTPGTFRRIRQLAPTCTRFRRIRAERPLAPDLRHGVGPAKKSKNRSIFFQYKVQSASWRVAAAVLPPFSPSAIRPEPSIRRHKAIEAGPGLWPYLNTPAISSAYLSVIIRLATRPRVVWQAKKGAKPVALKSRKWQQLRQQKRPCMAPKHGRSESEVYEHRGCSIEWL